MFVDSFIGYLRVERNYSQHTLRAYAGDVRAFKDFITGVDEIDATENGSKAVMYNLSGTRANTLQKGNIYVTSDGKTVLVQ